MTPLEAFQILDLRVGRVLRAEPHEKARKPSYKLWVDLGPLGAAELVAHDGQGGRAQVRRVALHRARELGYLGEFGHRSEHKSKARAMSAV